MLDQIGGFEYPNNQIYFEKKKEKEKRQGGFFCEEF